MTPADLPAAERIGERVHPDYPEDAAILAERLRLYPEGCLALPGEDAILGYAVGHPWRLGRPPKLNTLLGSLPLPADTFYIHDVALLPAARGTGAGGAVVARLADHARHVAIATLSLVAVGRSQAFWKRQGFAAVADPALAPTLRSYGASACFMVRSLR